MSKWFIRASTLVLMPLAFLISAGIAAGQPSTTFTYEGRLTKE